MQVHGNNVGAAVALGIGPLTNLAVFLRAYPLTARKLERIVFMGGSAGIGNATSHAEFNAWHDPEALAIVIHSGIPTVMYGLDVFVQATLAPEQYLPLADADDDGAWAPDARALCASALGESPSESEGLTAGGACRGGGDSESDPGAGVLRGGVLEVGAEAAGEPGAGAPGAGVVRGAAACVGSTGAAGASACGLTRRLRKGRSVRTARERFSAIARGRIRSRRRGRAGRWCSPGPAPGTSSRCGAGTARRTSWR